MELSAMSNLFIYYVYAYIRIDGTPYYIGKGRDKRAYNNHGKISVPKDKSRILFLETNLSNIGACALERRYIRWYGRKDLGTGILRNMTDGGDGTNNRPMSEKHKLILSNCNKGKPSHRKGKKLTIEHRTKIGISNKGKPATKGHTGKKHTLQTKAKLSAAQKGKKHSIETRSKMSDSQKGRIITLEHKAKLSAANKGKNPWNKSLSQGFS